MAEGAEVASAFVTLIPSFRGGKKRIEKELAGVAGGAGARAGETAGRRFGSAFIAPIRGMVAPLAGVLAGLAIKDFIKDSVTAASDLNETLSKSQQIFGSAFRQIDRWARTSYRSVGLSREAALAYTATLGDMFRQLGFTRKEVVENSKGVVQLAADLGSFHNLDTADVLERIMAGFRGEYDSLQLLIPNINAARIETVALAKSGKESADALTAQEKAAAVLSILYKDAGPAIGDFARTSASAANQQKIAQAQFENIKATLGQGLLPVWTRLLTVVNNWLPAVMQSSKELAGALAPAMDRVWQFATNLFDSVTELFRGFSSGNKLVPRLGSVFTALVPIGQTLLNFFRQIAPALAMLGRAVGNFVSSLLPIVQQFLQQVGSVLGPALREIGALIKTEVVPAIAAFLAFIQPAVAWILRFVGGALVGALQGAVQVVKGALTVIVGVLRLVMAVFRGDWSAAWDSVKKIFDGVWQAIVGAFKIFINIGIGKAFSVGAKLIMKVGSSLWSGLGKLFQKGINAIWNWVKKGMANLKSSFTNGMLQAAFVVGRGIGSVLNFFRRLPGQILNFVRSIPGRLKQVFSNALRGVTSVMRTAPSKIRGALGRVGQILYDSGRKIISGLINGIRSQIKNVKNAVGDVLSAARDLLPFSPAKEGPFSGKGWTLYSGRSIVEGLAEGMKQREAMLRQTLEKTLQTPQLGVAGANLNMVGGDTNVTVILDGEPIRTTVRSEIRRNNRDIYRAYSAGIGGAR